MIVGALEDLGRYRGLFRSLDVLIDWLDANDPASLPLGSNPIEGENVFANVMDATTRRPEDAHYETHRRYMDLQIDLEGSEAFKVALGEQTLVEPYVEGDDFELVDAAGCIDGDLADGKFVIFMANEPHMPTLIYGDDGASPVHKICFKLILDEYFQD